MKNKRTYYTTPVFVITALVGIFVFIQAQNTTAYIDQKSYETTQHADHQTHLSLLKISEYSAKQKELQEKESLAQRVQHIDTPESVRAIYLSSWVGGAPSIRNELISFVESSDLNAVIIDIKDSTGIVSFPISDDPHLAPYATDSTRIRNIQEVIAELHQKGIYVIGRLTIFQDPALAKKRPDLAFNRIDNGATWTDRKGLAFTDPKKQEVWDYTVALSEYAYNLGFDEINFDYIRYPSDGAISNIHYGFKAGESRSSVLKELYQYLDIELRQNRNIPISADIFGLATTSRDDLGIGQVLEDILPYFDAVAPMVYPSHYARGSFGYDNPNKNPYSIVKIAMESAKNRALAIDEDPAKLRTWIQDFSLDGVSYGTQEVQAQIKATYDIGLSSYMAWDPRNRYTRPAYNKL